MRIISRLRNLRSRSASMISHVCHANLLEQGPDHAQSSYPRWRRPISRPSIMHENGERRRSLEGPDVIGPSFYRIDSRRTRFACHHTTYATPTQLRSAVPRAPHMSAYGTPMGASSSFSNFCYRGAARRDCVLCHSFVRPAVSNNRVPTSDHRPTTNSAPVNTRSQLT